MGKDWMVLLQQQNQLSKSGTRTNRTTERYGLNEEDAIDFGRRGNSLRNKSELSLGTYDKNYLRIL